MRIRSRILIACLSLASVTIALGLFVLQGQRELGNLALRIYDDGLMSISYARSAEKRFAELRGQLAMSEQTRQAADLIVRVRDDMATAASRAAIAAPREPSERQLLLDVARGGAAALGKGRPGELSERQALLAAARGTSGPRSGRDPVGVGEGPLKGHILSRAEVDKAIAAIGEDLDVAIERAMSDEGRKSARALRERVTAIAAAWPDVMIDSHIDAITVAFDELVEQYAADGLQLRAGAEDLVARGARSTTSAIGGALAIALLITWALSRAIVPAVRKAVNFAEDIADGRLDSTIVMPRGRSNSETAALLVSLSRMQAAIRESLDRAERLRAENAEAEENQARLRKAEMRRFVDEFERAVGDIIDTVSSAATELEVSAGVLTTTAERSRQLAAVVDAASEEASANVRAVASAAETMASSADVVSQRAQASATIAREAVRQANRTNDRVSALSKAASRIGDVVDLINTIAGQTNLLALNATIEAARAGEAGLGFAVVASEVKALAQQTAKATEEISQQVSGIQTATSASVAAIEEIGATIGQMSDIAATIAATVEEQGAANREISQNVRRATHGTEQVSTNISDVQRGAVETGAASAQVLSSARSLAAESSRLKDEVRRFLGTVRAA